MPKPNFIEILRHRAETQPEETAYLFMDGGGSENAISYGALWTRVCTLAGMLRDRGAAGQRILLIYPQGVEFIAGFFATLAAGAIAVPLGIPRKNQRQERIQSILQNSEALFVLSVEEILSRIWTGEKAMTSVHAIATDQISDDPSRNWQQPDWEQQQIALLQFTSGATADPKGVILSHDNLIRNCGMIVEAFELTPFDRGATWLPTYHDMGLIGGVLTPMLLGRPTVLMSPLLFFQQPLRWLQTISKHRVTVTGGPDFGYQLCVDKISSHELHGLDLSCWQVAFTGAETIRAETLHRFTDKFSVAGFQREAFLPCYGLAEATLIVSGGPRQNPVLKKFQASGLRENRVLPAGQNEADSKELVGCGRVLTGEDVVIVDPGTLRELAPHGIGEICVSSPGNGLGYWRDEPTTAAVFRAAIPGKIGPYLRTGDLGFLHEGQLFVTGRLKDVIVVRGVNRYPMDIEATCEKASSAVQSGGVAALSVEHNGNACLVIVAESVRHGKFDWNAEMDLIRRAILVEHDLHPAALYFIKPGSLPRTTSAKIQRQACRQLIRDKELKVIASRIDWDSAAEEALPSTPVSLQATLSRAPGLPQLVSDSLMAVVRSQLRDPFADLNGDSNLATDLGLDSLGRLTLVRALEKAFGGQFPEDVLRDVETISDLALVVQRSPGWNSFPKAEENVSCLPEPKGEIHRSSFHIDEFPEVLQLHQLRNTLSETGLPDPYFVTHEGVASNVTEIAGRSFINFGNYNYLGLAGHPEVSEAARKAIGQFGTSASASRLVSGNLPVHDELELAIAAFTKTEAALVFVGGYSTNETTIGHLMGSEDLILHDSLAHNSIVQGARLSGARRWPFEHNNLQALEQTLDKVRDRFRRVLIAVEGVYSMDGDIPDLNELVRIKQSHRCLLMVDEAHSLGTMGETGRGITEHCGIAPAQVDILMGTLSKSLASCGGFIAGSRTLIDYLRYTAPGFVYSVAMTPASAAAALAAFHILKREPERLERLRARSRQFLEGVRELGFNVGKSQGTPIIPLITGSSQTAMELSHKLFTAGINAPPVLYPAVAESGARTRFFISADHTALQMEETLDVLSQTR